MSTSSGGGIVRVRSKTTMLMPNADQHRQATSHHYGGEMAAARSPFNHMTLSRQHQISVSNTHDLQKRRQGLSREEDFCGKRKSSRSGTRNGVTKKAQQRSSSRFGSFEQDLRASTKKGVSQTSFVTLNTPSLPAHRPAESLQAFLNTPLQSTSSKAAMRLAYAMIKMSAKSLTQSHIDNLTLISKQSIKYRK